MTGVGKLARGLGLDALIVITAIWSVLEVALAFDEPHPTLWFGVPAIAAVVLPLLGRRRFPFASAASVWLVAAAASFVDGRLIVETAAVFIAGMRPRSCWGTSGICSRRASGWPSR